MNSLKMYTVCAVGLGLLTLWLLPIAAVTKLFILLVLVFCAVFTVVEARNMGKTFAALVVAALTFYLVLALQRGVLVLENPRPASLLLGVGLVVLPILGAWAAVKEIVFGSRVQQMTNELDQTKQLVAETLPRSASGRVDRALADAEWEKFRETLENDPRNWKNWFHISTLYGQAGDRKRARRAMRIAWNLRAGRTDLDLSL